jgi:hypothetical protein
MRHRVEMYPFDVPKARVMRKNKRSECMRGGETDPELRKWIRPDFTGEEDGSWILHAMKRGIKRVCAKERPRSRCGDQMRREGKEQRYRPNRSPTLKRRMWIALKRSG